MILANQLRLHRKKNGFSQAEIATKLNISRQSISKWETGKVCPDINNLILLSEIYKVSIDELVKENNGLKKKIIKNEQVTNFTCRRLYSIHKQKNLEKDEGLLLLTAVIASSIADPLGLFLAPILMKRNKKSNTFYRLINILSVSCFLLNFYFTFIILF